MKLIKYFIILFFFNFTYVYSSVDNDFLKWKKNFKKIALQNNISENTFDIAMSKVRFLPKVIEYDRYQPEFYEDTKTYIEKRVTKTKIKKGLDLYKKILKLLNKSKKIFMLKKN